MNVALSAAESVSQMSSVKKVFLEISQNSQVFSCVFSCEKFLRTSFFTEHPRDCF